MTHSLLDNPAPIFLVAFILSLLGLQMLAKPAAARTLSFAAWCGVLSIAMYVIINALNIWRVGMLWHDEANILSISAAYIRGQQMYQPVASTSLYSLGYGPWTFLVYAPFLAIFSHPMMPIRIAVFVANILNVYLLFTLLRTRLSRSASLSLLPIGITFLLVHTDNLLGTRGDDWLLLCVLLAATSVMKYRPLSWVVAALLCGLFSGLAIDIKATVVPVICLVLAILYRRYDMRAAALAAAACASVTLATFCLPRISLSSFLAWLTVSGHQGFLKSTAFGNVLSAVFLLAPIVLLMAMGDPLLRVRSFGKLIPVCAAFGLLVCIVTGAKSSAGAWHLWPMLPFLLVAAAYELSLRSGACTREPSLMPANSGKTLLLVAAIAFAGAVTCLHFCVHDFQAARPPASFRVQEADAQQELEGILAHHHHLAMGEGVAVTDYRTDLRYELPLAGNEYFFDENTVVEKEKAGMTMSPESTARMLECGTIWMIPHGEAPFSSTTAGLGPMSSTGFVFPDALRLHFADTHVIFQQGSVYDLWKCPSDIAQMSAH